MEVILGFIGAVTGAVLTYLGVRFTARQNARAAKDAATVSNRQVDVEEWKAIVAALRDEVARLSTRVDNLEKKRDTLEAEARTHESRYRVMVRYLREVLAWAHTVAPAEEPPRPPEIIREELSPERIN